MFDTLIQRTIRALESGWTPVILAVVTAATVLWVWGRLNQIPVVHDEAAYLLQAEIFASGRWVAPSPPLPEFFHQFYVINDPIVAAKYPPGHSLALAPGVLMGLPGLVPLVLSGLTGALVFVLARKMANGPVAWLTWLVWLCSFDNLYFRASYFSEVTTSFLWVLCWWILLKWHQKPRPWLLFVLAALTGWGAITRPMTMLAFFIPVAAIVLRDVYRRGLWRDFWGAVLIGSLMVAIIPLWSWQTMGSWNDTPLGFYTRMYQPTDRLGFVAEFVAPMRPMPADMAAFYRIIVELQRNLVEKGYFTVLLERLLAIGDGFWRGWRIVLIPFALVGIIWGPLYRWVGFVTFVALILLYSSFLFSNAWTLYYLDALPILAFFSASGIGSALRAGDHCLSRWKMATTHSRVVSQWGALGLSLLIMTLSVMDAHAVKASVEFKRSYHELFEELLARLPEERIGVFVRYRSDHNPDLSLTRSPADLETAPVLRVYDRGPNNRDLMRLLPDRTWYLFDEASWALYRYRKRSPES